MNKLLAEGGYALNLVAPFFNAECKHAIKFIAVLSYILYAIKITIISWARVMVKEIEELIKIVGKGNLLEALFIGMGSFQHNGERDDCSIDCRNHLGVSIFAKKKQERTSRLLSQSQI